MHIHIDTYIIQICCVNCEWKAVNTTIACSFKWIDVIIYLKKYIKDGMGRGIITLNKYILNSKSMVLNYRSTIWLDVYT